MQKCLQCSRVGDDIGLCGAPITCPKQGREIDPATDIVIRCDLCDITRAVSVNTLTKHQDPRLDNACQSDVCKAYVVVQKPAKTKAPAPAPTPAPVTDTPPGYLHAGLGA